MGVEGRRGTTVTDQVINLHLDKISKSVGLLKRCIAHHQSS